MQRSLFSLKNAQLRRFGTSFLSFSQFSGKAIFERNRFTDFMGTPLYFSSVYYAKQSIFSQKYIDDLSGPGVVIKSCLFKNCKVSGSSAPSFNGGGLSVNGDTLTLELEESSFYNCDAVEGHGGGVYFDGDAMYAKRTCFAYCESDFSGQAIFAQTTKRNNIYVEVCDVSRCTNVTYETGEEKAPINLLKGKQRVKESNITHCIVSEIYSALYTDDSDSLIITFNNFEENTGNIVIGIENSKFDEVLYCCNVINNRCPDGSYALIYVTAKTVFSDVLFVGNSPLLVQANEVVQFTFDKCVFDDDYDSKNVTSSVTVAWSSCIKKEDPSRYKFSIFDTRYCWLIDPPKLPAGSVTYWFLIVFLAFSGIVGYTTFISYKRITTGAILEGRKDINPNPLVKSEEASYDSTK